MNFKKILLSLQLLFFSTVAFTQTKPPLELPAYKTTKPIKIDGLLNDEAWKDAPVMKDMTEFRRNPGAKERFATRTIAYLMYNETGIYFGTYCYENSKDSIAKELSGRDGFGTNDYVGLTLDTYYDKLNGFEYFVTPLNEQWDAKMSPPSPNSESEDFSWNAVWESNVAIHNDGWSLEMFIPFSAIRFGNKDVQDWGLNITRRRRTSEEQYTWNPIDPRVNGFLTQEAVWKGLSIGKPPIRLQFSPYFSSYINHFPSPDPVVKSWSSSVNGGMDVKFGINQAFTLDMTLIPDFGQVQSDNLQLNLSPFEIKYAENRPFFTEGTELFGKGNLFYSRRIGGFPVNYITVQDQLQPNEHIVKNPVETKLINATKISGRTQKGLGVGFFNALSNPQYAIVEDDSYRQRKIETNPLTNYNILVLNQSLKNNSSISLINTNVWRSGKTYDANVTAALFDFNDKKNRWNYGGEFASSNIFNTGQNEKTITGFSSKLYFGKSSGRFTFKINQSLSNAKYNSRDMGYFTFNNFLDHSMYMGYNWLKPTNWYNKLFLNFNSFYSRQLDPSRYRSAAVNVNANTQLKNLWNAGAMVGYEPEYNDFNEPRVEGRFFRGWKSAYGNLWVESNDAKKYKANINLFYLNRSLFNGFMYEFEFFHRYRFNDKFSIAHELGIEPQVNNIGFASIDGNDIIFGRRDRNEIENVLNFKYNFNAKSGINTRVRHYWSKVNYKQFYTLQNNGSLLPNFTYGQNENKNVNFFNIDFVYTWQFAPGSFLNLVWKNSIMEFRDEVEKNYFHNIGNTLKEDQNNNLSLKIIYYLDYLDLKKWKKKK
ncbi:MAG: carbohydrate binding family 9 domain-containing protein [Chitinophagaceae bacterium]|nr:carbohydrate binding family 9 domain-containing protein [Chitinophagaceae bacterium]